MRIFTNEEKLKAIELLIQYEFIPGAVITQIGYPAHLSVLYRWYKAYKANSNCFHKKLKICFRTKTYSCRIISRSC